MNRRHCIVVVAGGQCALRATTCLVDEVDRRGTGVRDDADDTMQLSSSCISSGFVDGRLLHQRTLPRTTTPIDLTFENCLQRRLLRISHLTSDSGRREGFLADEGRAGRRATTMTIGSHSDFQLVGAASRVRASVGSCVA